MKRTYVLGAMCAAAALVTGCHDARVSSVWRGDRAITIDGKKADWSGLDVYQFEDKKLYLGLANDAESLYLVLVTQSRAAMMQGLSRGLRIRFRPEHGSGLLWVGCPKAAGFPPGRMGRGDGPSSRGRDDASPSRFDLTQGGPGDWGDPDDPDAEDRGPNGDRAPERNTRERDGLNEKMIQTLLDDLPKEIEIYTRAGEDSLKLSSTEAARRGIEEAMALDEGYLVLEMRVPLQRDTDHPQAIGLLADALTGNSKRQNPTSVEVNFMIPKRAAGEEREQWRGGGDSRPHGGGTGAPPTDDGRMPPGGGFQYDAESPDAGFQYDQDFPGGGGGGGGFPGGGRRGGRMGGPGGRQGMPGVSMNGLDLTIYVALAAGAVSAP